MSLFISECTLKIFVSFIMFCPVIYHIFWSLALYIFVQAVLYRLHYCVWYGWEASKKQKKQRNVQKQSKVACWLFSLRSQGNEQWFNTVSAADAFASSLCSFCLMPCRDTDSHLSSSTSVRFYPHDLVSIQSVRCMCVFVCETESCRVRHTVGQRQKQTLSSLFSMSVCTCVHIIFGMHCLNTFSSYVGFCSPFLFLTLLATSNGNQIILHQFKKNHCTGYQCAPDQITFFLLDLQTPYILAPTYYTYLMRLCSTWERKARNVVIYNLFNQFCCPDGLEWVSWWYSLYPVPQPKHSFPL